MLVRTRTRLAGQEAFACDPRPSQRFLVRQSMRWGGDDDVGVVAELLGDDIKALRRPPHDGKMNVEALEQVDDIVTVADAQ